MNLTAFSIIDFVKDYIIVKNPNELIETIKVNKAAENNNSFLDLNSFFLENTLSMYSSGVIV
ncbi:hypothetical protein bcgnr5369_31200 [Bacillus cereus]